MIRARVLDALLQAGEGGVSGQALAERLGVSRMAVSKHVAALRAEGFVIEAVAGRGYRLLGAPEAAIPAGVRPLVTSPFWTTIEGGEKTGSTNDDARVLARAGSPEGTAVVAARQSAGRGRLGRSWQSPVGGAYVSVVLRPTVTPMEVPTLALALGAAVARALDSLGVQCRLKWPNDVLIGNDKVAGVLVEMSAEADRIDWVVAGVGVNVVRTDPARTGSAYVTDEAPETTPAQVAAAVLDEIARAYGDWLERGLASLHAEYRDRDALAGNSVEVTDAAGKLIVAGVAHGVDEEGRLLVRASSGAEERIVAGEVTLRPR